MWVNDFEAFLYFHEYNLQDTSVLEHIHHTPTTFQLILAYKILSKNLQKYKINTNILLKLNKLSYS